MKIVDIGPYVLSTPLEEPFAFSQGRVDRRSAMVVEVKTDEGISGRGESLCHGFQPPEIAASFVEFCFKPMLVGRDPFDVEVLWEEMYNRTRPFGGGAAVNAMSGTTSPFGMSSGDPWASRFTSCWAGRSARR